VTCVSAHKHADRQRALFGRSGRLRGGESLATWLPWQSRIELSSHHGPDGASPAAQRSGAWGIRPPRTQGDEYSRKVPQPGPPEMPHTRSSWTLPSRAAAHRSQVLWPGSRPLSRKNTLGGPSAAYPAASGQCAESAVSRSAPAAQTEGQRWQDISSPRVRFLVTLHKFTTRISPNICCF
jgi:hypothetical protein